MTKIALVTGANKGIGLATARQLAQKSFIVLVGARDEKRGESAAETLRNEGLDARFLWLDPTDGVSMQSALREIETRFGVLDVLVNNAAAMLEDDKILPTDVPTSVLRDTFEINVFALHEVTRALWPLLNLSQGARLVNVSSVVGSISMHAAGTFGDWKRLAYDSSKAAVNMMTTHYAHQWKNTPHRANAAHPGSVKTDMFPSGPLTPEQGAKTSVQLATMGEDCPIGGFFHLGKPLAW